MPQTHVDEIARDLYRISTPVGAEAIPGGFTFNQFLLKAEEPLLFHTGPRRMFPLVRDAVARVLPPERLRWVSFSHFEADECGSLNEWLAVAPRAQPLCGRVAAMVSIGDVADRAPRALADGETLPLGGDHSVTWLDVPHMPHSWECGYLMEGPTGTLLCGDLFTQPGDRHAPLVETDILGPSEAMRSKMDYFSQTRNARTLLEKLAGQRPTTLACMHGSSWRGDGGALLCKLADVLGAPAPQGAKTP